jgi:hypothetical protein
LSDSGSKKASSCHSFSSYIPLLHFVLVTTASAETWNANSSTCDCLTVDCSAIKHFSLAKEPSKRTGARAPPIRSVSTLDSQSHSPARTLFRPNRTAAVSLHSFLLYRARPSAASSSLSTSSYPLSFIARRARNRTAPRHHQQREGPINSAVDRVDARPPR